MRCWARLIARSTLAGLTLGWGRRRSLTWPSRTLARDLGDKDQSNFESTANSIEREAFALKDQLLLLDDYLGTPEHRKILAFIARNAANNSGRARLASDGTLRGDKPPRALVVTTGEDLPVRGEPYSEDAGASYARGSGA